MRRASAERFFLLEQVFRVAEMELEAAAAELVVELTDALFATLMTAEATAVVEVAALVDVAALTEVLVALAVDTLVLVVFTVEEDDDAPLPLPQNVMRRLTCRGFSLRNYHENF